VEVSIAEVPEAEGFIAEEKHSSIAEGENGSQAEGFIAEEKPVAKPEGAVEKPRDILANPKTEETAAAQALRKAQGREASALRSTTIPSEAVIVTIVPKQITMNPL
jgi:transcriptional accessory protein Tex/SPT6